MPSAPAIAVEVGEFLFGGILEVDSPSHPPPAFLGEQCNPVARGRKNESLTVGTDWRALAGMLGRGAGGWALMLTPLQRSPPFWLMALSLRDQQLFRSRKWAGRPCHPGGTTIGPTFCAYCDKQRENFTHRRMALQPKQVGGRGNGSPSTSTAQLDDACAVGVLYDFSMLWKQVTAVVTRMTLGEQVQAYEKPFSSLKELAIIRVETHPRKQTHETTGNSLADQCAKQFAPIQVHRSEDGLVTPDHFYETLRQPQSQAFHSVGRILGVWRFLPHKRQEIKNIDLPYDPAIPILGICPKELETGT